MLIEPVGLFQRAEEGVCQHCDKTFPYRSNKKFCSDNCRKRHHEQSTRYFYKQRKLKEREVLFERAQRLGEVFYQTKKEERLGFLKSLIDLARSGEDNHLRLVLTNFHLLRANYNSPGYLFINRRPHNRNIAKLANKYCRKLWGAGVRDVVYNKVKEPDCVD